MEFNERREYLKFDSNPFVRGSQSNLFKGIYRSDDVIIKKYKYSKTQNYIAEDPEVPMENE